MIRTEIRTYVNKSPEGTHNDQIRWELDSLKSIDHDDSDDRRWLAKHVFWAIRNGRKVSTHAIR